MFPNDYDRPTPSPRRPCQNHIHDLPFPPLRLGSPNRQRRPNRVGTARPSRRPLPHTLLVAVSCIPPLGESRQDRIPIIITARGAHPGRPANTIRGGRRDRLVPPRRDRVRAAAEPAAVRYRSAHPHRPADHASAHRCWGLRRPALRGGCSAGRRRPSRGFPRTRNRDRGAARRIVDAIGGNHSPGGAAFRRHHQRGGRPLPDMIPSTLRTRSNRLPCPARLDAQQLSQVPEKRGCCLCENPPTVE